MRRIQSLLVANRSEIAIRVMRGAAELGIRLRFEGSGVAEQGVVVDSKYDHLLPGQVIVRIDPRYYRPTEVDSLLGDATRARTELGWEPQCTFEALMQEMTESDYRLAQRDALVENAGYTIHRPKD